MQYTANIENQEETMQISDRTAGDIVRYGADLVVHFAESSRTDFKAYAKEEYRVDLPTALKWMRAARRFIDIPSAWDLPGPAIVQLGIIELTEDDAMLLIDAMRIGRINATAANVAKFERYLSHPVLWIQEEVRAYLQGETLFPSKTAMKAMTAEWEQETWEIEEALGVCHE